jgi:hypothetical protein
MFPSHLSLGQHVERLVEPVSCARARHLPGRHHHSQPQGLSPSSERQDQCVDLQAALGSLGREHGKPPLRPTSLHNEVNHLVPGAHLARQELGRVHLPAVEFRVDARARRDHTSLRRSTREPEREGRDHRARSMLRIPDLGAWASSLIQNVISHATSKRENHPTHHQAIRRQAT